MRPPDYSVTLDVSRNREGCAVVYAPEPTRDADNLARHLSARGLRVLVTDDIQRGWRIALEYWPDYIVQIDTTCDIDTIPALVWALESNDMAIGSRHNLHWSQRLFAQACNLASGNRHSDWTCVLRAYRADLLWSLAYKSYQATGQGWQVSVLNQSNELGASITEIPFSAQPERLRITEVFKPWLRLFRANPRPRVSEVELW